MSDVNESKPSSLNKESSDTTVDVSADTGTPLSRLLKVLDIREIEENVFEGDNVDMPGGRIFGGQVFAQGLIAAGRTVPEGRNPHSAHGYFLRPGKTDAPLTFSVERLNDGRSFSTRRTHAFQYGRPILSMISSFQEDQPGFDHQNPMPQAPDPDAVRSALDELGPIPDPVAQFWSNDSPFDVRHANGSLFLGPVKESSAQQMIWLKARGDVPDSRLLNSALLAYSCDQAMLEPVLRAHGESWATPGLSVASLDHAMWWHRPLNVSDWFLFVQSSPSAQGGRGLGAMTVYDRSGTQVATIMQEGMIRTPQADA